MATFAIESGNDARARPLFSWPPNPAMCQFQITARSTLFLNNIVGIGLCFAGAARLADAYSELVSLYIAGAFQSTAFLLHLFILRWNLRIMRNSSRSTGQGYERVETSETNSIERRSRRIGMLRFVSFIDLLGFVAYLSIYPVVMHDVQITLWEGPWGQNPLPSYASATCVVSL